MKTEMKTEEMLVRNFTCIGEICEGLRRVCGNDGKWFHVKLDYTPAYPQRYGYVGDFCEGLAEAYKDGRWFHIRPDGSPAYEERYKDVCFFSEGRARACDDNGMWFHILTNGKPAYPQKYKHVGFFFHGQAEVDNGERFAIGLDGKRIA